MFVCFLPGPSWSLYTVVNPNFRILFSNPFPKLRQQDLIILHPGMLEVEPSEIGKHNEMLGYSMCYRVVINSIMSFIHTEFSGAEGESNEPLALRPPV